MRQNLALAPPDDPPRLQDRRWCVSVYFGYSARLLTSTEIGDEAVTSYDGDHTPYPLERHGREAYQEGKGEVAFALAWRHFRISSNCHIICGLFGYSHDELCERIVLCNTWLVHHLSITNRLSASSVKRHADALREKMAKRRLQRTLIDWHRDW
jgi:hypothetical protein